jgi:hypothetical protein
MAESSILDLGYCRQCEGRLGIMGKQVSCTVCGLPVPNHPWHHAQKKAEQEKPPEPPQVILPAPDYGMTYHTLQDIQCGKVPGAKLTPVYDMNQLIAGNVPGAKMVPIAELESPAPTPTPPPAKPAGRIKK